MTTARYEIPFYDEPDAVARWVWENLVPRSGQSEWVQGELLRCVEKLSWEAQNNGNCNWDRGFEILADYLESTLCGEPGLAEEARQSVHEDLAIIRKSDYPYTEDDLYDRLRGCVVAFCRIHTAVIPKPRNPELSR
jgi:hypothetical protein